MEAIHLISSTYEDEEDDIDPHGGTLIDTSTEAQEEEVADTDIVVVGTQLQTAIGSAEISHGAAQILSPSTHATTLLQEQLDVPGYQILDFVMNESESTEVEKQFKDSDGVTDDYIAGICLPPPPKSKCSDEQEEIIKKFLNQKRLGRNFNAEMRYKKEYRNPHFLLHAVAYQDIDEIGSCFRNEIFDPHGYDKSDFYDEIEADMKREMEQKKQERKNNQKVEFLSVRAQSRGIPISVIPTVTAGTLRPFSSTVDSMSRRSKWDKVDGEQTMVGAHATFLTTANSGSGYTAFPQQRQRADEKKSYSIEKKMDKRP